MADDEIDLAPDVNSPPDWLVLKPVDTKKEPGFVSDLGNAVTAGSYGLASATGGAAEYIGGIIADATGIERPEKTRAVRLKEWGQAGSQEATGRMSKQSQREAAAGILPNSSGDDVFDKDISALRALALKATMSVPSLVASIVPGTLVARAMVVAGGGLAAAEAAGTGAALASRATAAGTTAGVSAGTTLSAGGVFEEIQSEFRKMSDKDLQSQVEPYAILREDGMSEKEARQKLETYVIGAKPIIMAAVTAGTSAFGVEHLAAGLVAGSAAKGVAKNALKGAAGEAVQETIESGVESGLNQTGKKSIKSGSIDWYELLDKAVEGGAVGGLLGGVTGGTLGRNGDGHDVRESKEGDSTATEPVAEPPGTAPAETAELPPAASEATPSPALEEDVDLSADDEAPAVGDRDVAAAMAARPAELTQGQPDGLKTQTEEAQSPATGVDEQAALGASQPAVEEGSATALTNEIIAGVKGQLAPTMAAPQAAPEVAPAPVAPVTTEVTPEVPTVASGPRILKSETEDAQKAEAAFREQWNQKAKAEQARQKAEGTVPTVERVRDTGAVSGDAVAAMSRRGWMDAAKRIVAKDGDTAPPAARGTVALAEQLKGLTPNSAEHKEVMTAIDAAKASAAEHYRGVTQERAKAVEAAFDNREAVQEAVKGKGAKTRQLLKKRADKANDGARDLVVNSEPGLNEDLPDVNTRAKSLTARLTGILSKAKEQGVTVPTKVTEATSAYANVLKRYKDALPYLSTRRTPKGYTSFADFVADVQTDELIARKGSPAEVADKFRIEGDMRGSDGSEQADVSSDTQDDISQEDTAESGEPDSAPRNEPAPRPAPKIEDDGVAPVYGAAKKTAVVEAIKRRTVTPKPANPTTAQAAAGNYQKVKRVVFGLPVTVETAKGQMRHGGSIDGDEWSVKMPADYGYVRRTTGADGEQVDVYLGPHKDISKAPNVFIVNQIDPATGKFDEHKAMIGFESDEQALDAYVKAFSDGSGNSRIGSVDMMSVGEFREWLKSPQKTPSLTGASFAPNGWGSIDAGTDARKAETKPFTGDGVLTNEDIPTYATKVTTLGNALASARVRTGNKFDEWARSLSGPLGEAIRKMAPDLKVYYLDESAINATKAVKTAVEEGRISNGPGAYYDWNLDAIVVNNGSGYMLSPQAEHRMLVHEGLHAVLGMIIERSPQSRKIVSDMLEVARIEAALRGTNFYGLTNEHEFISEAMSNPEFQSFLASIDATAGSKVFKVEPQNYWTKFIDFARSVVSYLTGKIVERNMLEEAVRATAHLFDVADIVGRRNESGDAPLFIVDKVKASADDHAKATGGWMRRMGYKFSSLDYLRQANKDVFVDDKGDALDAVVKDIQRMQPKSRKLRETSETIATEMIEWTRNNYEEAAKMADLAVEATMLNVNLLDDAAAHTSGALDAANVHLGKDSTKGWQAKANLREMQRRFMALSPEARALWNKQTKYYRDTQNQVISAAISNVLEMVNDKLTPAQIADITAKTMAGTLTDAELTLVGNKTVFNDLKNAAVLKKIDGAYFPLMRHGNIVVQTRLKQGDTMGGTFIKHDTIEFKAATDKDARTMARAFVSKTDMPVSSAARVYYDKATGKQLSADDAKGRDVTVAYRVRVQRDGMFMFDTGVEAAAFVRENAKEFESISKPMDKAQYNTDNTLSAGQLAALMSAVRGNTDISEARKSEIEQALHQTAARLLPGNRIQKRTIKRKNMVGASNDLIRAMLNYGQAASGYISRSEFMPKIRESMSRMRAIMADKTVFSSDMDRRSMLYSQIEKRLMGNVEKVQEPNRLVQMLMTVSYLDKLASPAYSILNATQVLMTTYPYLSGKHGAAATAMQLQRAYSAIGMGEVSLDGLKNTGKAMLQWKRAALDTKDVHGAIKAKLAEQKDGKQLIDVLDELRARGALDDGAGFELASTFDSGAGPMAAAIAKVDRIARQLPAAVEQMNRAVAAIAAYRLATSKGNTHEQAREFAFDTTMLTQFDYSTSNSPTLFQHPLARLTLQFKKYAANMAVLLYDMTRQAFKGATLEERKYGRRALANLIATQIVTAGALSLPGLELVKVFAMLSAALGLGGGYDDIDRWLRKMGKEAFGDKATEIALYGLPRAAGIDVSTRLSLADMFLFGEPKEYNQEGVQAYLFRLVSGAPISYVGDVFSAGNNIVEGETQKAVEKLIPLKVIADTAKAMRLYRSGDINAAEAGAQAVGLRPASQARKSADIGDSMAKKSEDKQTRTRLERQYMNGDAAERKALMPKIKAYNEDANWREKIAVGGLDRRIKANDDKRAGRKNPDNKEY